MITMKAYMVLHQFSLRQWLQDFPHPSHHLCPWNCLGGIWRDILTDALGVD